MACKSDKHAPIQSSNETISESVATSSRVVESNVNFTVGQNYILKPVYNNDDVSALVITSDEELDSYFDRSTDPNKEPVPYVIDFYNYYVLAVVSPKNDFSAKIIPNNLSFSDGILTLSYRLIPGKNPEQQERNTIMMLIEKKYKGQVSLLEV